MGATSSIPVAAPAAIRNILFATDFSHCSEVALPYAIALARQHGAALFLTHILAPEPRYELPLEPERDEMNAAKQEALTRFMALLDNKALAEVVHAPILRSGAFWETMEEVMVERDVDFIVIGTHGRAGLRKLLLGSRAELIFRNARCPVLTIGPQVRALAQQESGPVLFATDFTPASRNAWRFALHLARQQGRHVTAVHAVVPPIAAIETMVLPSVAAEMAQDARARLTQTLAESPDISSDIVVTARPAAEAIVDLAEERKAAMIVLGVQHRTAMATHVPWSVADTVVGRAPCPVLTVRGD